MNVYKIQYPLLMKLRNLWHSYSQISQASMKKIILLFVLLCAAAFNGYAQSYRFLQTEIYAIQAFGGILSNSYSSSFTQFGNTVSCDEFTSGSGNGFSVGLQVEYPLTKVMSLTGGFVYNDRSGMLTTSSTFPIRNDQSTLGFTQAIMENSIDTKMQFLEFQSDIRYNIFEVYSFALRGIAGLRFGILSSGDYDQTSRIVSPEGIGFVVGDQTLQERTLSSGAISTFNGLQLGGVIGIEPMLRVSPSMHITASALYDIPFTSALSDATLNISGFRGQIGLRYSIRMFAPSPSAP